MRPVSTLIPCGILLIGLGCAPIAEFQTQPFVKASASAEARWSVDINRVKDGVFIPYRPRCFKISVGHTVEFRNFLPRVPANVTGLDTPAPLYSPNLVFPNSYVGEDDPLNTLCDELVDGQCLRRPEYSYWRFTFDKPGVYDWLDTNQGTPGRKIIDPYYGTETFIGIDPDSPLGTICVQAEDGGGCDAVCCSVDTDCTGNTRCFKSEFDAVGRCLTPTG